MALQVNDTIDGKYRIVRLLGEGGMGAVYEGENTRIHRRVAIKVLHASVAQSKDAVERFEREAQAAGRIGSEHIVEVLDLGNLPNGERYLVMEFLEGESLADRIAARGKLEPSTVAQMAIELLEGLKAAHEAGIIHRDLKPDNVFLLASRSGRSDFVKIVDFGISKFSALGADFSMTRTGAVMGTPYYMAPEQAKGERTADHRADVYSVGVILYEAVAGEVPFNAETFNELLFKIVLEEAMPLVDRVPGLDARFSELVGKAMARSPAERFQSAADLQSALSDYLDLMPVSKDKTAHSGTPRRAFGAGRTLQGVPKPQANTHGAWANTHSAASAPTEVPPGASRAKWLWGGGGAALIAVAAGGWFVTSSGDKAPVVGATDAAVAAASAAVPSAAVVSSAPAAAVAPAPPSNSAPEKLEARAPESEPTTPTNGAAHSAADAPDEVRAKKTGSNTAQKSRAAKPAPAARATSPAPAPTTRPSTSSTSTGRTIRTTL